MLKAYGLQYDEKDDKLTNTGKRCSLPKVFLL